MRIYGILVMALLVMAVMPLALAEETSTTGGVTTNVTTPPETCMPPIIYTDATQRSWYPNDQTFYMAEEYGSPDTNLYGDHFYDLSARGGSYLFTGETLTYYVIVGDGNGKGDINSVILQDGSTGIGSCAMIAAPTSKFPYTVNQVTYANWDQYVSAKYGVVWSDTNMQLYKCKLVVQNGWNNVLKTITIKATDNKMSIAGCSATPVTSAWSDQETMNPTLDVDLTGLTGSVNFGNVAPNSTATSNTVYLKNDGGAVMDMYIASDDYFTDPNNGAAICGDANGIPYNAFSYYATKGTVDSGSNNNFFPGLGDPSGICKARADEFTQLPSNSGSIGDMCRIINHAEDASFLTQGQRMSLTFRLDVPTPCSGSFTNGQFHFVGRAL